MKLFNLIATSILGAAMVISGGVAVRSVDKNNRPVLASEETAYSLSGTTTASGTSYNGENAITQGGVNWKVNGNVGQNPWRIGGNKNNGLDSAGVIRHIQSQAAVSTNNIKKVVVVTAKPSSNAISSTNVSLKVGTAIL